jgi:hypothetical protein
MLAVGLIGLQGCNGPSPGLDPQVTLTVDKSADWPNFPASGTLAIEGKAATQDDTDNPVVYARWTQDPPNVGTFVIQSNFSMNNLWKAPAEVTTPTRVNLTLTTKSLLGGESATSLQLIVLPRSVIPIYDFDYSMFANPFTAEVKEGTRLTIKGTGVTIDPVGDPIVSYQWIQDPDRGVFDHDLVMNPIWTAPALEIDATTGQGIPETIKIRVRVKTRNGYESTNSMLVTVISK